MEENKNELPGVEGTIAIAPGAAWVEVDTVQFYEYITSRFQDGDKVLILLAKKGE